ncbi:MAG: TlpA family protein disulfide reductase [Bacteroidota bacterium]|nr:TlpA family protein disulfide reductase [Bacteroidota bacterium]
MAKTLFFFLLLFSGLSCLKFGEPFSGLPPGMWRGVLYLTDDLDGFDEKSKGELPFNFEVVYTTPDSFHLIIHNGAERIRLDDIKMGIDRRTSHDTLWVEFPIYDSYLRVKYEEDAIEGFWVARNRKDYQVKFKALHGQMHRFFQTPEAPAVNLTGRWECHFEIDTEKPSTSIGDFVQEGNKLTGTFMSPTGDDRFLEGQVSGNRMFLSVFDGSHAYLYEAKILPDGSLTGIYRSGSHYKTYWEAIRSDTIELNDLGDPFSLTQMKNPEQSFVVSLPDPDGKMIDLTQEQYAGSPKIIQIMGTWCPNCRDETEFLLEYLKAHPEHKFKILGISFERHTDEAKAKAAIKNYRDKMNIPYTIVYGGSNNKEEASKILPLLNGVIAFPTLLFLDANNHVVATHTGFSGPATSGYEAFKKEFDGLVEKLNGPNE